MTVDFLVPVEVPWTGAGLTPRPQSGPRCAPHTRAPDSDVEIAAPPTGLGRSEEEIGILLKRSQGEPLTHTLLYRAVPRQLVYAFLCSGQGNGAFSSMDLARNERGLLQKVFQPIPLPKPAPTFFGGA